MCSISTRHGIKWGTAPASEPTSTLVLETPKHWFIDIRVSKDEPHQLDWGFAGTTETTRPQNTSSSSGGGQQTAKISHKVFRHWVDNRTEDPDYKDAGDMYPADENGIVLETGRMVNPDTGIETSYEEYWEDLPLENDGVGHSPGDGVQYEMWQTQDDSERVRGVIIRIGQYAQAVLREADAFSVERWRRSGGKWENEVKLGDGTVPFLLTLQGGKREDEVVDEGRVWRRVESGMDKV